MLREQDDPPCDNEREQFEPTTVNTVLGNPRVVLVPPAGSGEDKIEAPTAADIAGKGDGYHLDLPGRPVDPGLHIRPRLRRAGPVRRGAPADLRPHPPPS